MSFNSFDICVVLAFRDWPDRLAPRADSCDARDTVAHLSPRVWRTRERLTVPAKHSAYGDINAAKSKKSAYCRFAD